MSCRKPFLLALLAIGIAGCPDEDTIEETDMSTVQTTTPDMATSSMPDMSTTPDNMDMNTTPARTGKTECGQDIISMEPILCQPSQYCADSILNRCELGCLSDENCPDTEECTKMSGRTVGTCTAKPVADPCDDVTCSQGEVCQEGMCIDPTSCDGVTCPSGQTCTLGLCTAPPDPCDNVSCSANEMCVEGACQSTTPPDPCDGVTCPSGQTCNDAGMCVNVDPCADVSCGANQTCQQGMCINNTQPSSCTPNLTAQDGCADSAVCIYSDDDDTECRAFPACDANNECQPGAAGALCSTEIIQGKTPQCLTGACLNDTHCPMSQSCIAPASFPVGECSDGTFGSLCEVDTDCISGLACAVFFGEDYGFCE